MLPELIEWIRCCSPDGAVNNPLMSGGSNEPRPRSKQSVQCVPESRKQGQQHTSSFDVWEDSQTASAQMNPVSCGRVSEAASVCVIRPQLRLNSSIYMDSSGKQ